MKLETLLKQLEFEEEIEQATLHQFSKDKKKIKEISASAYDIKDDTFLLCKAKPLTRLITVVYLLTFKYDEYQALKIPDQIIVNTLKDIPLRSSLYLKTTGKIGITKEDVIWFRHIMNRELFKIGSLQFQPFEMIYLDEETLDEPYMSFKLKQKKALPSKTPVINVHVQYGANINAELVDQSLQECLFIIFNKLALQQ